MFRSITISISSSARHRPLVYYRFFSHQQNNPPRSTFSASKLPKSPITTPHPHHINESARRDIEQAEAHGVLVPPPTGTNWFRRTLHKGIQLAVFLNFLLFFPLRSSPSARNSIIAVSNLSSSAVER